VLQRALLIGCMIVCVGFAWPVPAAAQSPGSRVIFTDGTFDPADWSLTLFKTKQGSSAIVEQRRTGGNPMAFRRVFHQVAPGTSTLPSQVATSGAHAFFAPSGADLADIYRRISVVISCSGLGGQVYIDRDADGQYDPTVDAPLADTILTLAGSVLRATRSDAGSRGNFAFADIPAGRYTVTLDVSSIPAGLQPSGAVAQVVALDSSPRLDVDFGVRRVAPTPTPTLAPATATRVPAPGPSPTPGPTSSATRAPRWRIYVPIGEG
jgi:hypothetical protein